MWFDGCGEGLNRLQSVASTFDGLSGLSGLSGVVLRDQGMMGLRVICGLALDPKP